MKIVITGRGTSGSFQIRGAQLGAAIGARVERNAMRFDGADVIVIVKRCERPTLDAAHASGKPVIWDVVDAWPQPEGNAWTQEQAMEWLRRDIKKMRPAGIVAATDRMRQDIEAIVGDKVPVLTLPHHARPGIEPNPIRAEIKTIGYEGGHQYLGRWQGWLQAEAQAIGAQFVINPRRLADLDVVVAVRDCSGYPAKAWKSNVKLANAQGSGTPVILSRECGYLETMAGCERWVSGRDELRLALAGMLPHATRVGIHQCLLPAAPSLDKIAKDYLAWMSRFTSADA
jgi:hypothetical protein